MATQLAYVLISGRDAHPLGVWDTVEREQALEEYDKGMLERAQLCEYGTNEVILEQSTSELMSTYTGVGENGSALFIDRIQQGGEWDLVSVAPWFNGSDVDDAPVSASLLYIFKRNSRGEMLA